MCKKSTSLIAHDYVLVYGFMPYITSKDAAEKVKKLEQEELNDMISIFIGSSKMDIKQINQVASKMGIKGVARKEFGDYIESLKKISGKSNNTNFSWKELIEIAKEFLGE